MCYQGGIKICFHLLMETHPQGLGTWSSFAQPSWHLGAMGPTSPTITPALKDLTLDFDKRNTNRILLYLVGEHMVFGVSQFQRKESGKQLKR